MPAPSSVVDPVPPLATANVPPSVSVPDVVMGPPVNVRPVEPPLPSTLVTEPLPPVAEMVMVPEPLVMVMLVPAVKLAGV